MNGNACYRGYYYQVPQNQATPGQLCPSHDGSPCCALWVWQYSQELLEHLVELLWLVDEERVPGVFDDLDADVGPAFADHLGLGDGPRL